MYRIAFPLEKRCKLIPVAAKLFVLHIALLLLSLSACGVDANIPTVPQYRLFEASFTLPHQQGNPFDPAINKVDVVFTGPDVVHTVPAFWDGTEWKVRYAPVKAGEYSLKVTKNDIDTSVDKLSNTKFMCIASKELGFIRRDPNHVQRFIYDNGSAYYPFGMNQSWNKRDDEIKNVPPGSSTVAYVYVQTFARMKENNTNFARIWMNNWDVKALDWSDKWGVNQKPGELNLVVAKRWDVIMDSAEKSGVYVQMVLQHHGQYTNTADAEWSSNPYNTANGGFLKKPDDFFTDPTGIRLTKAKYRYIVARWGYSTHLLAYELFNEVQNIQEANTHFKDVINWHKTMADYIRSIDYAHHMITTSYTPPDDPLAGCGVDYLQIHSYVSDIIGYFKNLDTGNAGLPVFVGEWGSNRDQTKQFTHDGIWASIMKPTAGTGQYWFWDNVDKENWWPVFKAAGKFLQKSGVTLQTDVKPSAVDIASPDYKGDLTFTCPGGWNAPKSYDVYPKHDGVIAGLDGLPSFIQGNYHRELLAKPILFHVDYDKPGKFIFNVARIAASGAHPVVKLDNKTVIDVDYPNTGHDQDVDKNLSVDVPAGAHTISLYNQDKDWIVIGKIILQNYTPALGVIAKGNARFAAFWAYDSNRNSNRKISGALTFNNLLEGSYEVIYWDTHTGNPVLHRQGSVTKAKLILQIHDLSSDIAGTIRYLDYNK